MKDQMQMPVDLSFHKETNEKSNTVVNLNAILKKKRK